MAIYNLAFIFLRLRLKKTEGEAAASSFFSSSFRLPVNKESEAVSLYLQSGPIRINTAVFSPEPRRFFYTDQDSSSNDFYEWLRGFTDAEGCFRIKDDSRRPKSPFTFEFVIFLHKDDRKALEYIKSILGMGNVTERGKFASLSITKRTEVKVLIDIFSKFPLNTTKRFDFEDWKLAFENWIEEGGDRNACTPPG
jgi:hypothetical protein